MWRYMLLLPLNSTISTFPHFSLLLSLSLSALSLTQIKPHVFVFVFIFIFFSSQNKQNKWLPLSPSGRTASHPVHRSPDRRFAASTVLPSESHSSPNLGEAPRRSKRDGFGGTRSRRRGRWRRFRRVREPTTRRRRSRCRWRAR